MTRLVWAGLATLLVALFGAMASPAAAQDDGFSLFITVTDCDNLPTGGPFIGGGCMPADAYFEVTSEGGDLIGSCTASSEGSGRASGCSVVVPWGAGVVVWMDESTIPAGYELYNPNPQATTAPDGPPDGLWGGPVFIRLPLAGEDDGEENVEDVSELPSAGVGAQHHGSQLGVWLALSSALALGWLGIQTAKYRRTAEEAVRFHRI